MALIGRRIRTGSATCVVFLLMFASLASACNDPAIGVSASQVGPGSIVPFSFTGTDSSATWKVSVGGEVVASGPASGPTVSGTFVMPDLGSTAMRVNVEGFVAAPTENP